MNDSSERKRGYEFEHEQGEIYGKGWEEEKEEKNNLIILYFQKIF